MTLVDINKNINKLINWYNYSIKVDSKINLGVELDKYVVYRDKKIVDLGFKFVIYADVLPGNSNISGLRVV